MARAEHGNRFSCLRKGAIIMEPAAGFSLATWLCVGFIAVAADNPLVVELWPGNVPDETGNIGAERFLMSPKLDRKQVEVTEPTRMVTNVSRPTHHDLPAGEG